MAQPADYNHGDGNIAQQRDMYHRFNSLVHWGSLVVASLLALLVLWLCAHAGFLPSIIVAGAIAALGTVWLRRPKTH